MKTLLLAALFSSSVVFAGITPSVKTSVEDTKIVLSVAHDEDRDLLCHYKISFLENTLTYKRFTGSVIVLSGEEAFVRFEKDFYSRITRLKASVDCE